MQATTFINDKFANRIALRTQGSGPPLVLLHGGMGSLNHWHHNLNALAAHYTVHAIDMPGYGDSYTVSKAVPREAYADLVFDALNVMVPNGPFRLAAFSFGGIVAALCTTRRGERIHKLALMAPGGFERQGPPLNLKKIPHEREGAAVMREVLAFNLRGMMIADPAKVTDEAIDLHHANVKRTRYDGRHVSLTPGLMAQCLKQITCPVQIIWGDQDTLCRPLAPRIDECRAAMPGVQIEMILGAGHWVQYEAAETVNRLLLDFLK